MIGNSWKAGKGLANGINCCAHTRLGAKALACLPRDLSLRTTKAAAGQRSLVAAEAQQEQRQAVVGIDLGTTNSAIAVRCCSSNSPPPVHVTPA